MGTLSKMTCSFRILAKALHTDPCLCTPHIFILYKHKLIIISSITEFNQFLVGGMAVGGNKSALSRHAAEPIFALPKLQMEMRSKHQQSLHTPYPEG